MLKLDESLFDDDATFVEPFIAIEDDDTFSLDDLDDSLFEYEPLAGANASEENIGEAIPEGPELGIPTGVADNLIQLINDEWEAIQGYNNFREMILQIQKMEGIDYTAMLNAIDDIVNEENLHVGQLQALLQQISPNAKSINRGEREAEEQLASNHEWVNGKLKVDFHQPIAVETEEQKNPNCIDDTCSLADVDDKW